MICETTWNRSDCFTHRRAYEKCLGVCGCSACALARRMMRLAAKKLREGA